MGRMGQGLFFLGVIFIPTIFRSTSGRQPAPWLWQKVCLFALLGLHATMLLLLLLLCLLCYVLPEVRSAFIAHLHALGHVILLVLSGLREGVGRLSVHRLGSWEGAAQRWQGQGPWCGVLARLQFCASSPVSVPRGSVALWDKGRDL